MSLQDINNNYASDVENNQLDEEETDEQDININENNGLIDDDLNNIDFENIGMIPCEICQTMINFNDYSNHVSICVRSYNLRRERFNILNGFLNILNASFADNLKFTKLLELDNPWGSTFVNENELLVTEKLGTIKC